MAARAALEAADEADTLDHLVEQLRSRVLLLVLDNCEHVATTVGELSFDLLTRPDLAILATSRRRLGVVGEAVVLVEPLAGPGDATTSWDALIATDAGQLFVERSVAAGARWTGSAAEVSLVADVCRRLDGLPLAIELAAVELGEQSMPGSIAANTYRCVLGWTMRRAGRPGEAAVRFEQALTFLPRTGASRRWDGHATWVIESVAGLLAEVGAVEPAARLMGSAHHSRCKLDAPMPYWDRPRYDPDLQRIRDDLGDTNFETAWSSGLELDVPTAVRLAQAELSKLGGIPA